MFSFKAYFFNHDVYINEKYKYAAGEILTAYLNTNFYEEIVSSGMISRMKRLRDDLILNDDMDYEMHSKYNTNVYRALSIFENIHAYLNKIPPYNKTIKPDYMTLDDLINKYDLFFEDGIDDPHEEITWETTTQYGTGEINDLGHGILRLHTFCLDSLEDIKK